MSQNEAPAPRYGARSWLLLALLLLMYIFAYLDRSIMALMVDPIKGSLDVNDFQMGLLQGAAFGAFYALFGLPMGYLVDRYSKRWVLYIGITAWSISAALCGLARNFSQLAFARFGVGAGEATLVPVAYSTISSIFPRHRVATAISIFSLGSVLGSAIALGVGGYLIHWAEKRGGAVLPLVGQIEPWQFVFIVTGLPGVILAFFAFMLPEQRVERNVPAEDREKFLPFLRANKAYFLFNIGGLSSLTAMAYGFATWTPAFLKRTYGLEVSSLGAIAGIMTIFGAIGFLGGGLASDRLYQKGYKDGHMLPIICALPIVLLLAIPGYAMGLPIAVTIALLSVLHIVQSVGNPVAAHFQIVTPPALRGRVAAMKIATQHMLGISIGPALVGAITNYGFRDPMKVGYSLAITAAILAPLAFFLYLMGRGPSRRAMMQAEAREAAVPQS